MTKIAESGAALRRRLAGWFKAQALHVPVSSILRARFKSSPGKTTAADLPLFLPSQIFESGADCPQYLLNIEWRLRFAHALDSLELIRKLLLSRTAIITYKKEHTHGQREGTKSSEALASAAQKLNASAARYRTHYKMISRFASQLNVVGLEGVLHPLHDNDIRGINKDAMDVDLEPGVSMSWIWKGAGASTGDEAASVAEGSFHNPLLLLT